MNNSTSITNSKQQHKNSRFISKKSIKEFNITQDEIPLTMREFVEDDYTNFIERNIKVVKRFNDINKIVYLSKIKYNLEN